MGRYEYTKKPPVVLARKWDGRLSSVDDLVRWGSGRFTISVSYDDPDNPSCILCTLPPHRAELRVEIKRDDYIVVTDREVSVIPKDEFEDRYVSV